MFPADIYSMILTYGIPEKVLDEIPTSTLQKASRQSSGITVETREEALYLLTEDKPDLLKSCSKGFVNSAKHFFSRDYDSFGDKAFTLACIKGYLPIVRLFFDLLDNPYRLQSTYNLALAINYAHTDIALYLLHNLRLDHYQIEDSLSLAIVCKTAEVCKTLLSKYSFSQNQKDTFLKSSFEIEDLEITRLLLENGASPNQGDFSILIEKACMKGNLDLVKLLHEYGGIISRKCLSFAINKDRTDIYDYIRKNIGDNAPFGSDRL